MDIDVHAKLKDLKCDLPRLFLRLNHAGVINSGFFQALGIPEWQLQNAGVNTADATNLSVEDFLLACIAAFCESKRDAKASIANITDKCCHLQERIYNLELQLQRIYNLELQLQLYQEQPEQSEAIIDEIYKKLEARLL